jgi:hypothetical protein
LCGSGGAACVACASGTSCSAGKCQSSGGGTYEFKVESATISTGDALVQCGEGSCDLYLIVTFGSSTKQTPSITDNNQPQFGEVLWGQIDASELLAGGTAEVWDDDGGITGDDLVGTCVITIDAAVLAAGKLNVICTDLAGDTAEVLFVLSKN